MAKRFTDTNKYKKPFIRGLQGTYKLLWDYLYHDCDHAGIWIVDFEIAQIYIGEDMPVTKEKALEYFNKDEVRIIEVNKGSKWFIPSFIEFQYGILSETNRAHNSVIQILKKYKLYNKGLVSPLKEAKDKDKYKDKVKDKNNYTYNEFYDSEIKKSKGQKLEHQYLLFVKVLFGENHLEYELKSVLKIPNQVTYSQFIKLWMLKQETKSSIAELLLSMENDDQYTKGKKNLYQILRNWMQRNGKN